VEQLVHNTSYSTFKEVVGQRLGPQEGWQQVAQMFRLTQVAVQCAGLGSAVAQQIQQHTLKYFEDRFASWIVDQGGWVFANYYSFYLTI
jgi:alkylation response protein AidB-like acyl-CoA dehydrogenase